MNDLDITGKNHSDAKDGIRSNSPKTSERSDSVSLSIDEVYRFAYGSNNDMSNPSQSPPPQEREESSSSDSTPSTPTLSQRDKQLLTPPRTPWTPFQHLIQSTADGTTKCVTRLSAKQASKPAPEASGWASDQLPQDRYHDTSENRHRQAAMALIYLCHQVEWTKLDVLGAVAEVALKDWQDPKEEMTMAKLEESLPPGLCVKLVSPDNGSDGMNWTQEAVAEQEPTATAADLEMDVFVLRRTQEQVRCSGMEPATGFGSAPGALSVTKKQPSSKNQSGDSSNYPNINSFDGPADIDDSESSDSTISDPNHPNQTTIEPCL